ncbi:MAG: hypothetical protein GXO08_03385 [Aquificae bacterium]|nr:hypothetical protein [Aquificota bacterium]
MISLLLSGAVAAGPPFCGIEVKNDNPVERGFVTTYLSGEITRLFLETGWVYDCERGKPIEVVVNSVDYRGSAITENRFGGYTFSLDFEIRLPERTLRYHLSKFVALPDPSRGTLAFRSALVDLFETYSLRIKTDLLDYARSQN